MPATHTLGAFLKDRRTRLDPAALGFPQVRRRTPGLRREEVAQRANISPTWYAWLEQGRGGAPSAEVLNRIAAGLMLTEPERQHMFMLGLGRPPEVRYVPVSGVTPRLQRVLDAFDASPAMIKTATWDVVGWNRAAAAVLTDYGALEPRDRNILRLMFCDDRVQAAYEEWRKVARYVVAAFRADVVRIGPSKDADALIEDLSRLSPDFADLWRENGVGAQHDGVKHLNHPALGVLNLEFSTFAVDGRPELAMVVFNPATPNDADRIRAFMAGR